MRLVGIDPGGTTGWAVWDNRHLEHFEIGPGPHHGELWNLLAGEWRKADVIICESFDPWDKPEVQMISLEYIGIVKAACETFSMRLVMQGPQVKVWASNHKLKRWGVRYTNWQRYKDEADARRHILYFLAHNPYVSRDDRDAVLRQLRPAS